MPKEITGNIPYILTISDTNEWSITYGSEKLDSASSMRNDIVSLIIAQNVMEICAIKLREDKQSTKGKQKQLATQHLNKVIDGRFGLRLICDYMLDSYLPYLDYLKKVEESKDEKDKGEI